MTSGHRCQFRTSCVALALVLCTAGSTPSTKAEVIVIRGRYNYAQYNPKSGMPYTNQQGSYTFVARLAGMSRTIFVTNTADESIWSGVAYDGTNTLTFVPYRQPFFDKSQARTNTIAVTITPSPWLFSYPYSSHITQMSIPWLTYGLNPALAITNSSGFVDIPLSGARFTPLAYGWAWRINPSPKGDFVDSCEIEREAKLDVERRMELLRPELDYPENMREKTEDLSALHNRSVITNGFIATKYTCTEWSETNGLSIPTKATLLHFLNSFPKRPWETASLTATRVEVTDDSVNLLAPPDATNLVHDYRYKMRNRSRIFRYAEYALAPGEAWKGPADPVLLAKAQDWLRHGRRYDYYDYGYAHLFAWAAAVCLILAPLLFTLRKRRKQPMR